jgi:aminoglycoside 3-N-acetyltransferase
MCHSAFKPESGFRGRTGDVTDTLLKAIGDSGNLIMMSLPYRSMTYTYLKSGQPFDVRSTPSGMGLITEFFRRRKGVLRSLSPTHPVLAYGPKAEWIVADHEQCLHPCGPGSPFDKALDLEGKLVFFDTTLHTMTFFHWIEHYVQDRVGLMLYDPELFQVTVTDHAGIEKTVSTYAFSPEIIPRRRPAVLYDELDRRGITATRRVGNTTVTVVPLRDIVSCVDEMMAHGQHFYDI